MGGLCKFSSLKLIIAVWVLTGISVFVIGLGRWFDQNRSDVYTLIAFIACILDLILSLSANQANAFIIGLTLIGLADYRDGQYFLSGAILIIAANLKIYPVVFFLALCLYFKPAYLLGAGVGLLTTILPTLFLGFDNAREIHNSWLQVLMKDATGLGILDLLSAFQRAGLPVWGQILKMVVMIVTVPAFILPVLLQKRPDWRPWITLAITALLLLSPKTEVFTYVFLAPSYIFMTSWCRESRNNVMRTYGGAFTVGLSLAISSCRFFNRQWFLSVSPYEILRVIGALGFWLFAAGILGCSLFSSLKQHCLTQHRRNLLPSPPRE